MKKIITALGNPQVNKELEKEKEFVVLTKDIQYQDGIFEILEKNEKIDFLILSGILLGENNLEELIKKIKEKNNQIKIILILEKEEQELEKKLISIGVKKIYYNNQVEIEELISFLKNKEESNNFNSEEIEKMKLELENLKDLLIKNNINFEDKNINKKIENNKKIISIAGTGGTGKSVVTLNLANILREEKQKILIIDFDILNNSLHTILGVNEYSKKIQEKVEKNDLIKNKISIKELIIKINKNIDLISGINLIFDSKYKISSEKVKFILEELKEYYDTIIIDTSYECFFDYTKNILSHCDTILFLLEGNISEMKKASNLLKIYRKQWKIENEKINIIINKYNENSVDDKIIKNIFSDYKILGKIKFNKKYNNLINQNFEEDIFTKGVKKDYKVISNKIIKLKNRKLNLAIENIFSRFKYKLYPKN